jgi:hypothetical protein
MKYFYTLNRTCEHRGYEHIYLRVFARGPAETETTMSELFTLKWQGDHDSTYWYGFHFEMEAHYFGEALVRMKAAQSLFQRIEKIGVQADKVGDVIALLEQIGLERRVYDDRVSEYLLPDQVKGPEYRRWMTWLDGFCTCATPAIDEADAKAELLKCVARYVGPSAYPRDYASKLEAWISAGKPVREDTHRSAPDVRSIAEIIKPMKEPPVELPVAA